MHRLLRGALVVALAATGVVGVAGRTPSPSGAADAASPAAYAQTPDRVLLDRLYEETGAARELPTPSWTECLGELGAAFLRALLSPLRAAGLPNRPWIQALAWLLLAVIVVCLSVVLARGIVAWRRQPRGPAPEIVVTAEGGAPARTLARNDWRDEIRSRLERGDIQGALEALWWWLAGSLSGAAVDPSWTSRELLIAARRPDLRPQAALLDRMLYGPIRPAAEEVLRLVRALEGRLA